MVVLHVLYALHCTLQCSALLPVRSTSLSILNVLHRTERIVRTLRSMRTVRTVLTAKADWTESHKACLRDHRNLSMRYTDTRKMKFDYIELTLTSCPSRIARLSLTDSVKATLWQASTILSICVSRQHTACQLHHLSFLRIQLFSVIDHGRMVFIAMTSRLQGRLQRISVSCCKSSGETSISNDIVRVIHRTTGMQQHRYISTCMLMHVRTNVHMISVRTNIFALHPVCAW